MAEVDCFRLAIRTKESGGNYSAHNSSSGASGAYQFTFGTWRYALSLAGLGNSPYAGAPAANAPPVIQDEAANALMTSYYNRYGQSWYNVAEAWYGGPGAIGHPEWGGGPGYPTVGEYAADVMAHMQTNCGGNVAPPPSTFDPFSGNGYRTALAAWSSISTYWTYTIPGRAAGIRSAAIW